MRLGVSIRKNFLGHLIVTARILLVSKWKTEELPFEGRMVTENSIYVFDGSDICVDKNQLRKQRKGKYFNYDGNLLSDFGKQETLMGE